MSTITISNLAQDQSLDRDAMCAIRGGGNPWMAGLGPLATVNVDVHQNITQLQKVNVSALNDVGTIGAGFGPLRMDVSPMQLANVAAVF